MPSFEEAVGPFKNALDSMGFHYHEDLYHAIAKHLGPSIHDNDASKVACTDPKELETIKKNFLIGKLGLEDGPELDKLLDQACHGLGMSNRNKHRASFYYLLVALTNKESVFIDHD
ncbi:MAG: DUF2853 family protein [Bacteroidota bacterium]